MRRVFRQYAVPFWAVIFLFTLSLLACGDAPGTSTGERGSPESGQSQGEKSFTEGAFEKQEEAPGKSEPGSGDAGPVAEPIPEGQVEKKDDNAWPKGVPQAASVETKLSKNTAKAGEVVQVTCTVTDQYGKPFAADTIVNVFPAAPGKIGPSLALEKAGEYLVKCELKNGTLKDATPEKLVVTPGEATQIDTSLRPAEVRAGEPSKVTCKLTDRYGNAHSPGKATFSVTPKTAITSKGMEVSGTKPGTYSVACKQGASEDKTPAELKIKPGLPAKIEVQVNTKKAHYKKGEKIGISVKVFDKYGNVIPDVKVSFSSQPSKGLVNKELPKTLSFSEDGNYTVTIAVQGQTADGKSVEVKLSFKVDGTGPAIVFTSPVRAAMLTGQNKIIVKGKITDAVSGVDSLKVNGQTVKPDAQGAFSLSLTSKWGLNLLTAEAVDKAGNTSKRAQSFLWAPSYHAVGAKPLPKALLARMYPKAIHDGHLASVNDLNTIVYRTFEKTNLDTFVSGTLDSGTYKRKGLFGVTLYTRTHTLAKSGKITLTSLSSSLKLRTGGVTFDVRFKTKIPITCKVTYKAGLSTSRSHSQTLTPEIRVTGSMDIKRSGNAVVVTVKDSKTDVSKVKMGNCVVSAVKLGSLSIGSANIGVSSSRLQALLNKPLSDKVKREISSPTHAFVSAFGAGNSWKLSSLLGAKTLGIRNAWEDVAFTSAAGALGKAVALIAVTGIPSAKLGTPLRSQTPPTSGWSGSHSIGVALPYNLLNHALVTAWSSGALKREVTSLFSAADVAKWPMNPKGLKVDVEALLPPVLHQSGKNLDVALGDLLVNLSFDAGASGKVSVQAYVSGRLSGGSISLSHENTFQFAFQGKPTAFVWEIVKQTGLSAAKIKELEQILRTILPTVMRGFTSGILNGFPLPHFDLSALSKSHAIPNGTKITVLYPGISSDKDYVLMTAGSFGTKMTLKTLRSFTHKYAPIVYFHPNEEYFLSTADHFLTITVPYKYKSGGKDITGLKLKKRDKASTIGDMKNAKAYVNAKIHETYTDIQFWYFYPYNGAGTAFMELNVGVTKFKGERRMTPCGQHEGDWEHVTFRVDNHSGKLYQAFFSQHGWGEWARGDAEVAKLYEKGRTVFYSSFYGHAAHKDSKGGAYRYKDVDLKVFKFSLVDKLGKGKSFDSRAFQLLGSHFRGKPVTKEYSIVEPSWMKYKGRWGVQITRKVLNFSFIPSFLEGYAKQAMQKAGIYGTCFEESGPSPAWEKGSWSKGDE